ANARHRAEVVRLMVHRRARRQGLGRALMLAIEAEARRLGRTTLVLDTREGDPSEGLYRYLGWTLAGTIPRYARSARGTLDAPAISFGLLDWGGDGGGGCATSRTTARPFSTLGFREVAGTGAPPPGHRPKAVDESGGDGGGGRLE